MATSAGPGSIDPLIGDLRRSGLVTLLVLHYCAEDASYGNQLMERIGSLTGGAVAVNPNTMYPLLHSLEARGLIAGSWEHPERRSRRFYSITDAGGLELRRMLSTLEPNLDAIAAMIELLRDELSVH
ncbi:MAG: PadR family transcriptional regulator [Solirubrobacteraceae bacterium]